MKRIATKMMEVDSKKGSKNSTYNAFKGSHGMQEHEEFTSNDCKLKNTQNISILDKSFENT